MQVDLIFSKRKVFSSSYSSYFYPRVYYKQNFGSKIRFFIPFFAWPPLPRTIFVYWGQICQTPPLLCTFFVYWGQIFAMGINGGNWGIIAGQKVKTWVHICPFFLGFSGHIQGQVGSNRNIKGQTFTQVFTFCSGLSRNYTPFIPNCSVFSRLVPWTIGMLQRFRTNCTFKKNWFLVFYIKYCKKIVIFHRWTSLLMLLATVIFYDGLLHKIY